MTEWEELAAKYFDCPEVPPPPTNFIEARALSIRILGDGETETLIDNLAEALLAISFRDYRNKP